MSNQKPLVIVQQVAKEGVEFTNCCLKVYEDKVVYSDFTEKPIELSYDQIKETGSRHSIFIDEFATLEVETFKKKTFTVPNAKSKLVSNARKIINSKIEPIKKSKRINKLPLKYYFHHLSIHSQDLEASEKFYYLLKFEKVYEYKDDNLNLIHLKNGYCILEFFSYKSLKKDSQNVEIEDGIDLDGVKHFALKVPSIERAKKDIALKGINIFKDITDGKTGIKHFFVKDPDGTLIEIVEDDRDLDPFVIESNNPNPRSHLKLIP